MGEKMTTFDELISRSEEHSDREAGLPGRPDPVDRVCAGRRSMEHDLARGLRHPRDQVRVHRGSRCVPV